MRELLGNRTRIEPVYVYLKQESDLGNRSSLDGVIDNQLVTCKSFVDNASYDVTSTSFTCVRPKTGVRRRDIISPLHVPIHCLGIVFRFWSYRFPS